MEERGMELICPICSLQLNKHERTLRCENGHSFDVARQGYINLLTVGRISAEKGQGREELIRLILATVKE